MIDQLLTAQSVAVDIDEMVTALYYLTTDSQLRRRWGEAGRKRAEELYAWPVVIRQYRELWDECRRRFEHVNQQEWARADHGSILSAQYFRQFSHYPSELISSTTNLALRATGAETAAASSPIEAVSLPPIMRHAFHPAVFQALLLRLADWPLTFGSLVADVSSETGQPHDVVARQLMWLIKYGVVKPAQTVKEYKAEMARTVVSE